MRRGKGACGKVELGHLSGLLDKIQPAGTSVHIPPGAVADPEQVDAVAGANVKPVMQQIMERSPILAELIQQKQIGLVGGMYELYSGWVKFFD